MKTLSIVAHGEFYFNLTKQTIS